MRDDADATLTGALPYIRIDDAGRPSIVAQRCATCAAVLVGSPRACSSCGDTGSLVELSLGSTGRLHTWTIVHRSFPGVPTPFIACVVDIDGGGALRGTLRDVKPHPETLTAGMAVRVEFAESEQRGQAGERFMTYHFVPAENERRGQAGECFMTYHLMPAENRA